MTLENFQKNISLADHISFKLGGKADYFFVAKTKEEIIDAIKLAKEKQIPFYILAGGANVLVPDEGIAGLVIKIDNIKYKISDKEIFTEAGMLFSDIVEAAANASLSGLEWAAGIPGKIGGAIYGNAQAFGENMAMIVKEVEVFDSEDLLVKKFSNKECGYSEKISIFKKNKNLIILSCVLNLKKGIKEEIKRKGEGNMERRRLSQPLNYPSAGSVFVNNVSRPPSSYLIERAGLKKLRIGGAQVSEKHAGFIINAGGATCKDVLDLVGVVRKEVQEKFGIILEQEIQILGK